MLPQRGRTERWQITIQVYLVAAGLFGASLVCFRIYWLNSSAEPLVGGLFLLGATLGFVGGYVVNRWRGALIGLLLLGTIFLNGWILHTAPFRYDPQPFYSAKK